MKKLIFALIAGTAAMSAAQAQTTTSPRGYVGAGLATVENAHRIPGATGVEDESYKTSGKVFGGVDIDQRFGVEAGYTDFRTSRTNYTLNGVNGQAETDGYGAYVAGKATMPINERTGLYGKLGVAHTKHEMNASTPGVARKVSDNGVYAGVGLQHAINEQVSLIAEYERYGKKKDFGAKPDVFTIGAKYNF
ncbi:porin family protein [Massilia jejuensis]|uniref:Porin family protein n=1 Tax=Massilia jejuensis TaxID=648894 RepID=A0ABW0PFX1_9BURK